MNKYVGMTLVFVLGFAAVALAQVSTDNAYQTRYVANLAQGDSFIRIGNTGARGGVPATPGPGGEICANVYSFATTGQMAACCTCLVPRTALCRSRCGKTCCPTAASFPRPVR